MSSPIENAGWKDAAPADRLTSRKPKDLERSGAAFHIAVRVLAASGIHAIYLLAMFAMMKSSNMISCRSVGSERLGVLGSYVCDYTKAYMECFPELALTVCVLIIGRNLLHTRLYYGLLARGSVLHFGSRSAFKDALVGFFLWCYAHCVMHLFLLMWLIWQACADDASVEALHTTTAPRMRQASGSQSFFLGPNLTPSDPPGVMHAPAVSDSLLMVQLSLLSELFCFFVVPSMLFCAYLFTSYDIETSLSPLSQYFKDARRDHAAKHNTLERSKAFSRPVRVELNVLKDTAVKLLLEREQIHDSAHTVGDGLDEIVRLYARDGKQYEEEAENAEWSFIGISRAHWPCRLLVSGDNAGSWGASFHTVWMVFVTSALALQCFMMVSLLQLASEDLWVLQTNGHAAIHLTVVLVNISAVAFGVTVNARSVVQGFLRDYLSSREHSDRTSSKRDSAKEQLAVAADHCRTAEHGEAEADVENDEACADAFAARTRSMGAPITETSVQEITM